MKSEKEEIPFQKQEKAIEDSSLLYRFLLGVLRSPKTSNKYQQKHRQTLLEIGKTTSERSENTV